MSKSKKRKAVAVPHKKPSHDDGDGGFVAAQPPFIARYIKLKEKYPRITRSAAKVLGFVEKYVDQKGFGPRIHVISKETGLSFKCVSRSMIRLRKFGLISYGDRNYATVEITDKSVKKEKEQGRMPFLPADVYKQFLEDVDKMHEIAHRMSQISMWLK